MKILLSFLFAFASIPVQAANPPITKKFTAQCAANRSKTHSGSLSLPDLKSYQSYALPADSYLKTYSYDETCGDPLDSNCFFSQQYSVKGCFGLKSDLPQISVTFDGDTYEGKLDFTFIPEFDIPGQSNLPVVLCVKNPLDGSSSEQDSESAKNYVVDKIYSKSLFDKAGLLGVLQGRDGDLELKNKFGNVSMLRYRIDGQAGLQITAYHEGVDYSRDDGDCGMVVEK